MISEVLEAVRQCVASEFKVDGYDIKFVTNAPDVSIEEYTLGIYLASFAGEVYSYDASSGRSRIAVTFDFVADQDAAKSGEEITILDALIEFLKKHEFAVSNDDITAVNARADLGYPFNGFEIRLVITIGYDTDMYPFDGA